MNNRKLYLEVMKLAKFYSSKKDSSELDSSDILRIKKMVKKIKDSLRNNV
ncbi:MAG: hypothetical protein ACOX6Q_02970 [Candidatus Dojkabacteria bacterium]